MAESIRNSKKPKIGRPVTTGSGEPQVVRMHDHQLTAIDNWIEIQGEKISRPEAIRQLVEMALKGNLQSLQDLNEAKSHAAKAKKLAAELGLKAKGKFDAGGT